MSKDRPLPADMAAKWGHLPHLQYKPGANEWSSACPNCGSQGHNPRSGEPDRFHIHPKDGRYNARGKCRRCGFFEWVDSGHEKAPDPARIKAEAELRREYERQESLRLANQIERFKQEAIWEYYHEEMSDKERAMWREAGIPNSFQDYWRLGYMPKYQTSSFVSPALTIPYFDQGGDPRTVQYRLLNPPNPSDKYRFTKGLSQDLWLAEPDREFEGVCLLTEGMKKGAVTFINMVAEAGYDKLSVVSVPNKTPPINLIEKLNVFDTVYIALDPDAYVGVHDKFGKYHKPAINRMIKALDGPEVKAVTLPMKSDDFFTLYGGTADQYLNFIRQAVPVKGETYAN